jgi:hypothetical protein
MATASTNALFAFPNFLDPTAVYTPALWGGTWQSAAPLSNLQNRFLAYKARSVGLTPDNTNFVVDLGTKRTVQVVALPRHNLSLTATYSVYLFTDWTQPSPPLSAAVASAVNQPVFGVNYPFGTIPYENPSWYNGQITPEQWYQNRIPLLVILPQPILARYVWVQIQDTANPAGYVELSRMVVAPGWQPSVNIKTGAQIGVSDPTVTTTSLGEVDYFDLRTKRRTATVSIDYLPQNEAFAQVLDLQMSGGVSGQIFFSYAPQDAVNFSRHSFLATLTRLDPLTAAAAGYQSAAFSLQEVVG